MRVEFIRVACPIGIMPWPRLLRPGPQTLRRRPASAGDASSRKLGTFLVMSQFQGSVNSSAMFLTAAAQNLLCMKLAAELGVIIASPWLTWFKVGSALIYCPTVTLTLALECTDSRNPKLSSLACPRLPANVWR